jgi:hypothetical protein
MCGWSCLLRAEFTPVEAPGQSKCGDLLSATTHLGHDKFCVVLILVSFL